MAIHINSDKEKFRADKPRLIGDSELTVRGGTGANEKEFIEFGVTDDGSNIFHTEYGNLRTDYQIVVPSFEYTAVSSLFVKTTPLSLAAMT